MLLLSLKILQWILIALVVKSKIFPIRGHKGPHLSAGFACPSRLPMVHSPPGLLFASLLIPGTHFSFFPA